MKLTELVQGIGGRLGELFPERLMYVDKIPAEADGNFLLNIISAGGRRGISSRKSRAVSFDLLYFSRANDKLDFMEWSDTMHELFTDIDAGGQIFHTKDRTARCDDMVFHFLFAVDVSYIEFEQGELMEKLELLPAVIS